MLGSRLQGFAEHVGGTRERCEKMQFVKHLGERTMMTREKRIKVSLSSYFCVEQHAGEEEGRSRVLILEFFLFPDKQVENN